MLGSLLSLYQAQVTRRSGYRKPSKMGAAVFVGGSILRRKGRDVAVRFSESWGGLKKHIPLIESALKTGNPIGALLARRATLKEKWDRIPAAEMRSDFGITGSGRAPVFWETGPPWAPTPKEEASRRRARVAPGLFNPWDHPCHTPQCFMAAGLRFPVGHIIPCRNRCGRPLRA